MLTCGVPEGNRKARRLLSKLISETNVIPQSLYVTGVRIDVGGFGRVLKGSYREGAVALEMLDDFEKGQKQVGSCSLFFCPTYQLFDGKLCQEFCKEVLLWQSLRCHFILPLLGIFKEQRLQYLVSPLMPNGTLMDWRRTVKPLSLAEIHRLVRLQHCWSEC